MKSMGIQWIILTPIVLGYTCTTLSLDALVTKTGIAGRSFIPLSTHFIHRNHTSVFHTCKRKLRDVAQVKNYELYCPVETGVFHAVGEVWSSPAALVGKQTCSRGEGLWTMSSAHATGPALGSSMPVTRVPPESSAPARISTEPPRRNSPEDRSPSPSSRHDGGMNTLFSGQVHMCKHQWSHQSPACPDFHCALENFRSLPCRAKLSHRSHCPSQYLSLSKYSAFVLSCLPEERSAERDGTHVGAARGSRRDEPRDGVPSEEDGDNEEPKLEGKGNVSGLVGNFVRVTMSLLEFK